MGVIASEVTMFAQSQDIMSAFQKRNENVGKFLREWTGQENHTPTEYARDREDNSQYFPNYGLDKSLAKEYTHLRENSEFKFQFTAMSTLTPYLHAARGKIVYTVYTVPRHSEYVTDLLAEVSDKSTVPVAKPDSNTVGSLLRIQSINSIIAVRENGRIGNSHIAAPDRAFADLVVEAHKYGVPIDDLEMNRMFFTMVSYGLVSADRVRGCARTSKMAKSISALTECRLS